MSDFAREIQALLQQLDLIKKRQHFLSREIQKIEQQIESLKSKNLAEARPEISHSGDLGHQMVPTGSAALKNNPPPLSTVIKPAIKPVSGTPRPPKTKSELERFIGENLISVIGISVLVIGIAIGVKYAIDKDLISPLSRIMLGFGACAALSAVALYLRIKYQHFSAVLLSGAMAGFYFVTFVAYDFYSLFGQLPAFGLMVAITVSTVFAALQYNRQIIAQLGLVGAYAIPFLLDNGRGQVLSLFTYMAIINTGILFVGIKRYWRTLYYSSFLLSWVIFLGWYFSDASVLVVSNTGPIFLTVFFTIFYGTFLFYKIIQKEQFRIEDVIFLFLNVFIFYGIGMDILQDRDYSGIHMALFTAFNALVHGIVSFLIDRQDGADRKIFYLTAGLSLIFITLAVPVYWDGNWVTLIWMGEALIIFWTGTKKSNISFVRLSYGLAALAILSLFQDWESTYNYYSFGDKNFNSFFNIHFLSSLLCASALGYMGIEQAKKAPEASEVSPVGTNKSISIFMILAILVLYLSGYNEISYLWESKFHASRVIEYDATAGYETTIYQWGYKSFKSLWLIIYTMIFLSSIGIYNLKSWKNSQIGKVHLILSGIALLIFLIGGLYEISVLRDIYLGSNPEVKKAGIFHLLIRYIGITAAGLMLLSAGLTMRAPFNIFKIKRIFDISVTMYFFAVLSSELYHWMDVFGFDDFHKLGLSIFWGIFAVGLVGLGIHWRKQHLRVTAIVLFSITLLKLFFYDISHLNTISKTVVFVSLGILLLIISFLYNKYKHMMQDEDEMSQI